MDILLNELNKIQERDGYINEKEIEKIAKERGMRKTEVYGVISFYSRLYTKPKGKYIIRVCKSIVCGLNHSKEILKEIIKYLEIEIGETTKDNFFSLETVECLGHCGEAPVISINDKIYDKITPEKAVNILKNIRAGE